MKFFLLNILKYWILKLIVIFLIYLLLLLYRVIFWVVIGVIYDLNGLMGMILEIDFFVLNLDSSLVCFEIFFLLFFVIFNLKRKNVIEKWMLFVVRIFVILILLFLKFLCWFFFNLRCYFFVFIIWLRLVVIFRLY